MATVFGLAVIVLAGLLPGLACAARLRRQENERPGESTTKFSCHQVRPVPDEVRSQFPKGGLNLFYQKYTEAYGIPVLGSVNVSDSALQRACYVIRFLLADVASVRRSFYKRYGRVGVMAATEVTKDIPEHSYLSDWWNDRARGLGATVGNPITTCAEENLLCFKNDRYSAEDITLHEMSHAVQALGADFVIPEFNKRLKKLYQSSQEAGRWAQTYSMSTFAEYWAEGVQSFFQQNAFASIPDGIHNSVDSPAKLKLYDRDLYNLIMEVYPCNNVFLHRCNSTREMEQNQKLNMDCPPVKEEPRVEASTELQTNCSDTNFNCPKWAAEGACEDRPAYMLSNCPLSCGTCTTYIACDERPDCLQRVAKENCSGSLRRQCPKSCNACPTSEDPYPCLDYDNNCASAVLPNKCSENYYMKYCRKTCGMCWQEPYTSLLESLQSAWQMASAAMLSIF